MTQQSMLCERILLTNDDGIDAPGMAVLEKIAHQLSHDVWIVAPVHDQSGTSHSLSLHSPLRLITRQGKGYLHDIDVISHRDPRDLEYFWLSLKRQNLPDAPETEAAILQQGGISVTQLGFDRGVTRQNG